MPTHLLGETRGMNASGFIQSQKFGIVREVLRLGHDFAHRLAVELAGVGDDREVVHLQRAVRRVVERGALLADRGERLLDVLVGDGGVLLLDDDTLVVRQLEIGHELDQCGEAQRQAPPDTASPRSPAG
jgi:hypothetical protein